MGTPRIFWEATSRQVLTMEWIEGVKLTDEAKMAEAGLEIVDFVNVRSPQPPAPLDAWLHTVMSTALHTLALFLIDYK